MKHICCTPFKDCLPSEYPCEKILEDMKLYIEENVSSPSQATVSDCFSIFGTLVVVYHCGLLIFVLLK
uniref:Uncharacterized protein n=1 Tax=Arundo donax TaxID=35708 RepID=A0A0A9AMZ6_ARUDO